MKSVRDGEPRRSFAAPSEDEAVAREEVRDTLPDRVEMGDTIAGPVGVARRTVRAPADGKLVAIQGHRVLFEVRGEPIGLRRLLARPTTVYSIEAQERHESRQRILGK